MSGRFLAKKATGSGRFRQVPTGSSLVEGDHRPLFAWEFVGREYTSVTGSSGRATLLYNTKWELAPGYEGGGWAWASTGGRLARF